MMIICIQQAWQDQRVVAVAVVGRCGRPPLVWPTPPPRRTGTSPRTRSPAANQQNMVTHPVILCCLTIIHLLVTHPVKQFSVAYTYLLRQFICYPLINPILVTNPYAPYSFVAQPHNQILSVLSLFTSQFFLSTRENLCYLSHLSKAVWA